LAASWDGDSDRGSGKRWFEIPVRNQELAEHCGVRGIPNVKAFIDKLLPEPLRVAAQESRASGETELALSLLDDALQADPGNETVQLDMAEIRIDAGQLDAVRTLLGGDARFDDLVREFRIALARTLN